MGIVGSTHSARLHACVAMPGASKAVTVVEPQLGDLGGLLDLAAGGRRRRWRRPLR